MRLFPPTLEIDEFEGFVASKDIFGRRQLGDGLTNVIRSVSDPLVLAVDGEWGTGKTVFLRMWAGELRKSGFPVIYFDAFAHDYLDDAFTALAGEIVSLAIAKKKNKTPVARKFIKKAVGAGKVLLRGGLKVSVKLATMGALEAGDFEKAADATAEELSKISDDLVGKAITEKLEQDNAIEGFRNALAELPLLLSEQGCDDSGTADVKPLIFMIDELDRCRPAFALELLERIKHFFSVKNVHFVLGTNLSQLSNSVLMMYGPKIDADTYLQKFIHLRFHLIDKVRYPHERTSTKFVSHLVDSMNFDPKDGDTIRYVSEHITNFAHDNDLSLRAIERVFSTLAIALAFSPKNLLRPPPLIAGLCLMKVLAPALFSKAKKGTLTLKEAGDFLHFKREDEDFFSVWWRLSLDPNPGDDLLRRFTDLQFRYNLERERYVPFVANEIIDGLQALAADS